MLDPALRRKIRRLRLWARRSVQGDLGGFYKTAYRGSGLEFEDYRPYVLGDEIKHIDWKVTARHNQTHVRVYQEERDVVFHLLLDVSSSLYFGSEAQRQKIHVAVELMALLATLIDVHQDRCSLTLFGEKITHRIPAKRGEAHVHAMLQTVLTLPSQGQGTSLATALEELRRTVRKKSVVMVLSDFLDDSPYLPALKRLSRGHKVSCVRIYDPIEVHPPAPRRVVPLWQDIEGSTLRSFRISPFSSGSEDSWQEQWLSQVKAAGAYGELLSTTEDTFPLLVRMSKPRPTPRA